MPYAMYSIMGYSNFPWIDRSKREDSSEEPLEKIKCNCSIDDLMNFGCQCGAFTKEQEKSKEETEEGKNEEI